MPFQNLKSKRSDKLTRIFVECLFVLKFHFSIQFQDLVCAKLTYQHPMTKKQHHHK